MNTPLSILKFGGTSVGSGERIRHVAHIIADTLTNPDEPYPVVVVSAMAKVTDQLLRIARFIHDGNDDFAIKELTGLKQRHREVAEEAIHKSEHRDLLLQELENIFASLEHDIAILRNMTARDGQPYYSSGRACPDHISHPDHAPAPDIPQKSTSLAVAAVAAWGERLSVLLVAAAVSDIGPTAVPICVEGIITTYPLSDASSFDVVVGADPLPDETRRHVQPLVFPLIEQRIVPIMPGFIGRTTDGMVTTLGRNGSDYSATVIGAALDCIEVSIYTDVDGVLTADPRLVMNARLLPRLSYAEAARLSWFGAKVLHPRTLIPIAARNIPVRVRNTFRPFNHGTVVGPETNSHSGAAAITIRRHLALITVESTDLFSSPETTGQVFALAARAGVAPVAICSSSGHYLAFLVEEKDTASIVALLEQDMGTWRIRSRTGLAACACIGSGFTVDPMSFARASTALARERIPVITQGASEPGIMLVVEDADSERALRCLHRGLIAPVIPLVRHTEKQQKARKAHEI